ncbi:MAG: hypothetical protein E7510_06840 [Ruminococcus sp.]|nr:hypothetical protein [Ruminococcus sp.]
MKFTWFENELNKKYLTYADAGRLCGRSGTTIKNWVCGLGIQDVKVQLCMAKITELPINDVQAAVANHNAIVQRQSKKCKEYSTRMVIEGIKQMIRTYDYYDSGDRISCEAKEFINKRVDALCNELRDIEALFT